MRAMTEDEITKWLDESSLSGYLVRRIEYCPACVFDVSDLSIHNDCQVCHGNSMMIVEDFHVLGIGII